MKKALLKNTFREIKNTKARFISILMIIALGVGFFVGVKCTSPSMKQMAVDYYADTNLMDFKMLSTVGFDDDDVKTISGTKGIKDVMPSYYLDVSVTYENVGRVFRLHAVPSEYKDNAKINEIEVVEGRLPQKPGEIAVEKSEMKAYRIGDKITIDEKVGDSSVKEQLDTLEYTVVGIVRSPLYIAIDRGTTNVGNGKVDSFAYVSPDSFNIERYTVLYATLANAQGVSPFDEEYENMIDNVIRYLELKADKRVDVFVRKNITTAQSKIDDGRAELDEAKKEAEQKFTDAKAELEKGEKEYYSQIEDAQNQINEGQEKINSSRTELDTQWTTYNNSVDTFNAEIESAKAKIQEGYDKYNDGVTKVEELKNTVSELENRKVRCYKGNYSEFLVKKSAEQKAIEDKYECDIKEIERLEKQLKEVKKEAKKDAPKKTCAKKTTK